MISNAKKTKGTARDDVVVDLHPDRPDYRGFSIGSEAISMEAEPTLAVMETAGATVETSSATHTVLDNMFLISGEIPRVTLYEVGLKKGLRFMESSNCGRRMN